MVLRSLTSSVICALMLAVGVSEGARADAATATVTPATGGNGVPLLFNHALYDLATVGYEQSEFLIAGTADAYESAVPLTNDGEWTVAPIPGAATTYKTRMVVNRPIAPGDFSGTVIVEWFNVSGGVDAGPDWSHMHTELVRKGHVWVGVSAQWLGVDQLVFGHLTNPLAPGDSDRYGPPGGNLDHPGDSWSYDIYSQAGQAIRDQAGLVLGGLVPERLIGVGESQSAGRLTTYINAVHPVVEVYDGFVVHSRGARGSALTQSTQTRASFPPNPRNLPTITPDVATPTPTFFRGDLVDPVLVVANENDLGSLVARQSDSDGYRLWEIAGTAHFDHYGLALAVVDTGSRATVAAWFESMRNPTTMPDPNFSCDLPINTGPATFVIRTAVRALDRWIAEGEPPPLAPRFQLVPAPDLGSTEPADIYVLDGVGNVIGGIRTPAVDAPVARLNGVGQPAGGFGGFCRAFGVTIPLTDSQLTGLYGDHDGFVAAWMQATQDAVKSRFLLREDAQDIRVVGARSDVLK